MHGNECKFMNVSTTFSSEKQQPNKQTKKNETNWREEIPTYVCVLQ